MFPNCKEMSMEVRGDLLRGPLFLWVVLQGPEDKDP